MADRPAGIRPTRRGPWFATQSRTFGAVGQVAAGTLAQWPNLGAATDGKEKERSGVRSEWH